MMLSDTEYKDLWTNPRTPKPPVPGAFGFGKTKGTIPSYYQYLQREVYQQDYLDLFSGAISYSREFDGKTYGVPISLLPITVPPSVDYVINIKGKDCLVVDYDFPFSKIELEESKEIKYILIGEAPPPFVVPLEKSTYFYNTLHIGSTAYFNAPCKAFGIIKGSKRDKLVELAKRGVLLLDLFPFAIPYSGIIRGNIMGLAVIQFENIIKRLNSGDLSKCIGEECLKFSFLCSIEHYRAIIAAKGIISINGCRIDLCTPSLPNWIIWPGNHGTTLGPVAENWHNVNPPIPTGLRPGDLYTKQFEYRSYGKSKSGYPHYVPISFGFY